MEHNHQRILRMRGMLDLTGLLHSIPRWRLDSGEFPPPVMRFVAAPNPPDASPLNAHRLAPVNVRLSDQAMHDISRIILE